MPPSFELRARPPARFGPSRARRLAAALPLLLAAAGCPGSSGELGEERFVYRCASDADPYCDAAFFDTYCYGSCTRPFESNADEEVPGSIALGSRFLVLADPGGFSAITPTSVSPSIVAWDGDAFHAVALGEVALLAVEDGVAQDYKYIRVEAPARIRVDYIDALGAREVDVDAVTVGAGDRGWLRALTLDDGGQPLYGALPCAWSTGDGTQIELDSDPTDNLVRITADATETVTVPVHLSLGDFDATVSITVRDASALEGGAP